MYTLEYERVFHWPDKGLHQQQHWSVASLGILELEELRRGARNRAALLGGVALGTRLVAPRSGAGFTRRGKCRR